MNKRLNEIVIFTGILGFLFFVVGGGFTLLVHRISNRQPRIFYQGDSPNLTMVKNLV